MRFAVSILALTGALALAGCSTRQAYNTLSGWQAMECTKIADLQERRRCQASTDMSYEDYSRQREAAKGSK